LVKFFWHTHILVCPHFSISIVLVAINQVSNPAPIGRPNRWFSPASCKKPLVHSKTASTMVGFFSSIYLWQVISCLLLRNVSKIASAPLDKLRWVRSFGSCTLAKQVFTTADGTLVWRGMQPLAHAAQKTISRCDRHDLCGLRLVLSRLEMTRSSCCLPACGFSSMMSRGFSGSSFCSPWALLLVDFPSFVNFRFLPFHHLWSRSSTVAIVCVPCEQATVFLAGLFMQCNGRLFLDASTVQEGKKNT